MKKLHILVLAVLAFSPIALADHVERHIHLNGEHLTDENIALMDQLFGQTVPNANYLINMQTGEWGYEGSDEVHGVLDAVVQANQQQSQSNSQNSSTETHRSQNGSAISGKLNGQDCTFVSAGTFTFKKCD